MAARPVSLHIQPRILYQVAKAAWDGKLFERREDICRLVTEEFEDRVTRKHVANQIRIAMGLDPHDDDMVLHEHDEEALMGMGSEPVVVANPAACQSCKDGDRSCEKACPLGAISHDETGHLKIDYSLCVGDGHCVDACDLGALSQKSQFVPLIDILRQRSHPVYASVAPAFAGQFGPNVTPGKLRSALLKLGFTEMVETALYADLITVKEAFEYDHHVQSDTDFLLTSCCCPVWIKLIETRFPELMGNISPAVSPMVASGRVIKALQPEAKVVFIGPCVAKKSEAQLPDLKGAIDFVLTFQELETIFQAAEVNIEEQPDEENAQSSWAGRVYGRTGGVSGAVGRTLAKMIPGRAEKFIPFRVDGIPDCQKALEQLKNGQIKANFIEGMACKGGCVGGPGRIISPEEGTAHVNNYGDASHSPTPVENPHVYGILARLGSQEKDIPELTGESPMGKILARHLPGNS